MKVSKVSVSLEDHDINVVSALAKGMGLSFSAALRIVIREWDEHSNAEKQDQVSVSQSA